MVKRKRNSDSVWEKISNVKSNYEYDDILEELVLSKRRKTNIKKALGIVPKKDKKYAAEMIHKYYEQFKKDNVPTSSIAKKRIEKENAEIQRMLAAVNEKNIKEKKLADDAAKSVKEIEEEFKREDEDNESRETLQMHAENAQSRLRERKDKNDKKRRMEIVNKEAEEDTKEIEEMFEMEDKENEINEMEKMGDEDIKSKYVRLLEEIRELEKRVNRQQLPALPEDDEPLEDYEEETKDDTMDIEQNKATKRTNEGEEVQPKKVRRGLVPAQEESVDQGTTGGQAPLEGEEDVSMENTTSPNKDTEQAPLPVEQTQSSSTGEPQTTEPNTGTLQPSVEPEQLAPHGDPAPLSQTLVNGKTQNEILEETSMGGEDVNIENSKDRRKKFKANKKLERQQQATARGEMGVEDINQSIPLEQQPPMQTDEGGAVMGQPAQDAVAPEQQALPGQEGVPPPEEGAEAPVPEVPAYPENVEELGVVQDSESPNLDGDAPMEETTAVEEEIADAEDEMGELLDDDLTMGNAMDHESDMTFSYSVSNDFSSMRDDMSSFDLDEDELTEDTDVTMGDATAKAPKEHTIKQMQNVLYRNQQKLKFQEQFERGFVANTNAEGALRDEDEYKSKMINIKADNETVYNKMIRELTDISLKTSDAADKVSVGDKNFKKKLDSIYQVGLRNMNITLGKYIESEFTMKNVMIELKGTSINLTGTTTRKAYEGSKKGKGGWMSSIRTEINKQSDMQKRFREASIRQEANALELKRKNARILAEASFMSDITVQASKLIQSRLLNERADKRALYPSVRDNDSFNLILYKRDGNGSLYIDENGAPVIEEMTALTRNDAERLRQQRAIVDMTDMESNTYFPLHGKQCRKHFSKEEFSYLGRKTKNDGTLRPGLYHEPLVSVRKRIEDVLKLAGNALGIKSARTSLNDTSEKQHREMYELEALRDAYSTFTKNTKYNYNTDLNKQKTPEEQMEEDKYQSIKDQLNQLTVAQLMSLMKDQPNGPVSSDRLQMLQNNRAGQGATGVGANSNEEVTHDPNEVANEGVAPPDPAAMHAAATQEAGQQPQEPDQNMEVDQEGGGIVNPLDQEGIAMANGTNANLIAPNPTGGGNVINPVHPMEDEWF